MEAEAMLNPAMNGAEKRAPVVELEPMKDVVKSINLANLTDKRDKYVQSLKDLRAEREAIVNREKELDIAVGRTEGAIITLNSLIVEIDPTAAQQMGATG